MLQKLINFDIQGVSDSYVMATVSTLGLKVGDQKTSKLLDNTVLNALTLLKTMDVNSPECLLSKYESGSLNILLCSLLRKLTIILRTVLFSMTRLEYIAIFLIK